MPISILEYKQLCGRAGRPQYDDYGEAIIIGNSNRSELIDYYINGEPEPIESKITDDKSLRTHILSLIATNPGIKKDQIIDFFLQTLGGLQTRKPTIKFGIDIAIKFLLSENDLLLQNLEKKFQNYTLIHLLQPFSEIHLNKSQRKENIHLGFCMSLQVAKNFSPSFHFETKIMKR